MNDQKPAKPAKNDTDAEVKKLEEQLKQLQAMIDELGLQQQAELVGLLAGDAKFDAIMNAQALVLPSYNEAQPMAILEAMAAGLAVVATNVGDVPSVVRDGVDGLIVPPGEIDALAAAMIKIASDASLRRSMGRSGRQRVEEKYSLEVVVNDLIKIYDELLGSGK